MTSFAFCIDCHRLPNSSVSKKWESLIASLQLPSALPRLQQAITERRVAEAEARAARASPDVGATAECVVCMDRPRSHVLTPCGHLCLCGECVKALGSAMQSEVWQAWQAYGPSG